VGVAPPSGKSIEAVFAERAARERKLLAAIKNDLPELEKLLGEASGHWGGEDLVYRFYHQSWKVYGAQDLTTRIVEALRALLPDVPLNQWFAAIVREGTGRKFERADNKRWLDATRPILEAFFHARWFLEMVVRYGRELEEPPSVLPSGWAGVLYLYGLR
jgi:hypothetical protein